MNDDRSKKVADEFRLLVESMMEGDERQSQCRGMTLAVLMVDPAGDGFDQDVFVDDEVLLNTPQEVRQAMLLGLGVLIANSLKDIETEIGENQPI